MPFLQIMPEPTLSRLMIKYEQELTSSRENAAYPERDQMDRDWDRGSVYILDATIKELQQALQEDEEDRQAFIENLLDFWALLLIEWENEQPTERILPQNPQRYQIARIQILANVIHNINNLESYK